MERSRVQEDERVRRAGGYQDKLKLINQAQTLKILKHENTLGLENAKSRSKLWRPNMQSCVWHHADSAQIKWTMLVYQQEGSPPRL